MSWIGIWYETTRRSGSTRGELLQHVVERLHRLARALAHVGQVPERAHLGVDDLDVDAVGVHVDEPFLRVVVPGAVNAEFFSAAFIAAPADVGRTRAAGHAGPERGHRVVVGRVEPARELGLDLVVAHGHVRVGGDDPPVPGVRHRAMVDRPKAFGKPRVTHGARRSPTGSGASEGPRSGGTIELSVPLLRSVWAPFPLPRAARPGVYGRLSSGVSHSPRSADAPPPVPSPAC